MVTLGGMPTREAHMNKSQKTERKDGTRETRSPSPGKALPQTKRYDAEFKKAAVENWIETGKLGTQIAAELGISYNLRPPTHSRASKASRGNWDDPPG